MSQISNLSANNSVDAIKRYRENYDRAFGRAACWRCGGDGKIRDYTLEQIDLMMCNVIDGQCVFQMREMACPACKKEETR